MVDRPWLVYPLAAGTIALEVGFHFVRLRWFFVLAAVSLHLGICLAMALDYGAQALAVTMAFVSSVPIVGWAGRLVARPGLEQRAL